MATVLTPNRTWARLASDDQIKRTAAALEANGMRAIVVDTGDGARHQVFNLLPAGAQVLTMTSRTLETIGVAEEIDEPSEMAESRRGLRRVGEREPAGGVRVRSWFCDLGRREPEDRPGSRRGVQADL